MSDSPLVMRLTRRNAIGLLAGAGVALVAGCGNDKQGDAATATTASTSTSSTGASTTTAAVTTTRASATTAASALQWLTPPTETGGPFPADGSNSNGAGATANVLNKSTVFRTDMTGDLDGSNRQTGLPMTLKIKIGKKADRSAFAGAALYVWHCNTNGNYSAYSGNQNGGDFAARSFLRAVGVADGNGDVAFNTILPGRYQGRASHIHFAVFSDKSLSTRLITSQFAFDDAQADAIYKTSGLYSASLNNPTYNARDNVFSDGVANQLLGVSGTSAVEGSIAILV